MPVNEIKKVGFIGAGIMGCWNSMITAAAGYNAVVYDVSEAIITSAPDRIRKQLKIASRFGVIDSGQAEAGLGRISFTMDAAEVADNADLLSESILEKLELKRRVHQQFDSLCPGKTIITTNTSSLLVSEIEDAVKRRDRFAALHFHLYGKLVDIVAGPKTDAGVVDILRRFTLSIDQTPVVHTAEKDGYLWNTLLIQSHKTAILLVADGYGTVENVDRSVMAAGYNSTPPFVQLDTVGLDLARDIFQAKYERDHDPDFKRAIDFLDTYIKRGELGIKTGKGFYTYPNPAWQRPDFLRGQ